MLFDKGQAPFMPQVANWGFVEEVKDAMPPKAGATTISIPIVLGARGAGKKHTLFFNYNPMFLDRSFKRRTLDEYENNWFLTNAWDTHFANPDPQKMASIDGLTGGDKAKTEQLTDALVSLGTDATPEQVVDVLRDFLVTRKFGQDVGFVLKQRSKKNEEGERERTQWYDISYWFRPDAKGRKAQYRRAEKGEIDAESGEPRFVVSFNEETAF